MPLAALQLRGNGLLYRDNMMRLWQIFEFPLKKTD
jgi:hypothetical protein